MIFPNSVAAHTVNAPHFFNPAAAAAISLPFAYNGAQINYRDSSWLKLNVCELFLKNECPNIDNCSLAHAPNTVKIESGKVTVCYDFIKKKDCKHGNCKYYHPHDALASAILRRGDDSKKNGNSLSNLGMSLGLRSPLPLQRSQDILTLQSQNFLSSQMSNNLIADQQMKAKMDVMRQLNAPPQAWLPGLNVITSGAQTLAPGNPSEVPANISYHPSFLQPGVSAKSSALSTATAASTSSRPPAMLESDLRMIGMKRAASDVFGTISNGGQICASNDNNMYGLSDFKKTKHEMESPGPDLATSVSSHYFVHGPTSIASLQSSPLQIHLPAMAGSNMQGNFNIIQTNPSLQTAPISSGPYHALGPVNLNNIILQSLLANNSTMTNPASNMEALLALSAQKFYAPINPYPQLNLAQIPFLNQLYYQQLLQNTLGGAPQILYPGSVNLAELQQRTLEETSVAFINDKGTILETLPVCKDFLQGKCKRSQSCNYVHLLDTNVEIKDCKLTVCKNALKGQCHRSICKFYHIPTYQLQKLGLHHQAQ